MKIINCSLRNFCGKHIFFKFILLKGTGTQDLIWIKVLSLDRSRLVGLTDNL